MIKAIIKCSYCGTEVRMGYYKGTKMLLHYTGEESGAYWYPHSCINFKGG